MNTQRYPLTALRLLVAGILCGAAASSQAQPTNLLYTPTTAGLRSNYTAAVGCEFQVGSSNVIVSHLGYFGMDTNNGLNTAHGVGIMGLPISAPVLLGQVTVPAGAGSYWASNYFWVQLDPPLILSSNTQYFQAGLPEGSANLDLWPDAFTPTWNTAIVGTTATTTRHAVYAPNTGAVLPPASFSQNGNNNTYGDSSLAYIPIGPAKCAVQLTNVTFSAGQTVLVTGGASGQGPLTNQWWEVASPTNILISTTANPYANLVIPNTTTNTSGTYFLTASNALGGEQSPNVTVLITSFPVSLTKQPTNITAFANYPASFSISATGSPPVTYQWYRDNVLIPGATSTNYSLASVSTTNNGDIYTCVASNFTSGTSYTQTSSNAVLAVIYNLAQPQEFLHGFNNKLGNNTYGGQQGGQFVTANNPVLVTHLGFYAWPANTTTNGTNITCVLTNSAHYVGLYNANGTTLLGSVLVPLGTNSVLNGYMWQPLDPPIMLSTNTQYLLDAQTTTSGDPWGDTYAIPDLNSYIATSCDAIYGGNGWGSTPYLGGGYSGQMYSAPNLATLALPTPSAYALPVEGITLYAGFSTNLTASVEGQAPVTLQWYKEPGVLLQNQTNLILNLPNLAVSNSGSYYVIATNSVTQVSAQSADVVVTVNPDVTPYFTQDITPYTAVAVVGSSVTFSAVFSGSPSFTYGWQLNGNAVANSSRISGANGNVLTINDVQFSDAGTYLLYATNAEGVGSTDYGTLTVVPILPFYQGTGWSSQGSSLFWADTNIVELTDGNTGESNSTFSTYPLYVGAFKASFTYQCATPSAAVADGATFCLQNDPRGSTALGGSGGQLGVGTPTTITPSVELEFHIYTNNSVGGVGISFATNGAISQVLAQTNVLINSGDPIDTVFTYENGVATVTLTDTTSNTVFSVSTNLNIPAVLGTNVAYVGLTAGDGAVTSIQTISNFAFVSLPQLSAQIATTNLVLSWPAAIGNYMLEQKTNLNTAQWTPVGVTPQFNGSDIQAVVPLSGTRMFYQLVVTNVPNL
jgi:hypothetical protein